MSLIRKTKLTAGLYIVEIKDADLLICCGCPPDTIKYLKKAGYLIKGKKESSPNALLLSDTKVQKGRLTNFAEFPIMELLYNQGLIHNAGTNHNLPVIIGMSDVVDSQVNYLCRGNYGFYSPEEMKEEGIHQDEIQKYWDVKLFFSDGKIHFPEELCIRKKLGLERIEIKNEVFISRNKSDQFLIEYKGESCVIDFHPEENGERELPYHLNDHPFHFTDFAVVHCGEGNGWEPENPCMGSLLVFKGKIYAIDVGPGFMENINHLGLDVQDIEGLFLTHIHDDHFAGITDLLKSSKKIKFYSSKLVRITAQKKFSELLDLEGNAFDHFFDCRDLVLDQWNELDGLEIKPFFSPHPVDTNAFIFKANTAIGEKRYAHLADTFSINDLNTLLEENILTHEEVESIVSYYQMKCDVKKVDVGGGAIHGDKTDYFNDSSSKVVFSHTKFPSVLIDQKEEVKASFGNHDILSKGNQSALIFQEFAFIFQSHFPDISTEQIRRLFDSGEIKRLKRGDILNVQDETLVFTLHGNFKRSNVRFIDKKLYDRSCILGFTELFDDTSGDFEVNTSFVTIIVFEKKQALQIFSVDNDWESLVSKKSLLNVIGASDLFAHDFSTVVLLSLLRHEELLIIDQDEFLYASKLSELYFLVEGEISVYSNEELIGELNKKDFFGGYQLFELHHPAKSFRYHIKKGARLLKFEPEAYHQHPLVNWMIFEKKALNELHKNEYISPMQEELIEALDKSELFKVLDDEAKLNVSKVVHRVTVKAGETIVKEGEASDRLFLIVNGIGVVRKGLANEPEKILAYLMPGNTFGEVGILEHKPRSATVSALTDAELIEIPSDLFEDLLMKFPRLGIELSKMLGYYLTQTNNRITRGNKDNHLIAVFNAGDCKTGLEFSQAIAEKVVEQTEHRTIFIHYTGRNETKKLTNKFEIDSTSRPFEILTNWSELNFPIDSRISMTADRLLNTYDNLVIYFEKLPEENLSIILENLNQAIVLSNKKNYPQAINWRENLISQISHRNVEFFMLKEEKVVKNLDKVVYQFPERTVSEDGLLAYRKTVQLIADRLERNNRVGIFIPTTIDVNTKLDTSEFVNDTLNFLGKTFGGATSEEAIGVWNSKDIGIVDEKVFIVHSYTTAKMLKENLNQVVEYVKVMKEKLKQESMALEINKRLTLI